MLVPFGKRHEDLTFAKLNRAFLQWLTDRGLSHAIPTVNRGVRLKCGARSANLIISQVDHHGLHIVPRTSMCMQ
jgi:hypothetical protein